jgi:hypothetical protein
MFVVAGSCRQLQTYIKPEAAITLLSSWWWEVCRSKHVEQLRNIGIINSTTRSHLVGYFYTIITYMFEVSCTSSPCIPGDLLLTLFLLFWSKTFTLTSFYGSFTWTNIISCYIHTHIYFSLSTSDLGEGVEGRCAYYVKKSHLWNLRYSWLWEWKTLHQNIWQLMPDVGRINTSVREL